MIIEFAYTLEDLKEATRAHGSGVRRRGMPRWAGWVLFGALAIALFLMLNKTSPSVRPTPPIVAPPTESIWKTFVLPLVPWLLIFGFIWFFVIRARLYGVKRVWDSHPALQLRKTVDADESRLIIDDGQTRVEKKWTSIRRFIETPNLFLLYTSDFAFDMVPKRAFILPAQVDEFRRLLEQQIQPPTGGFPVQPLIQPPGSS